MKRSLRLSSGIVAALALGLASGAALGHPDHMGHGPMHGMSPGASGNQGPMRGPASMLTKQDADSATDMDVVLGLLADNTRIRRSVTMLSDGIRTVTESDDPRVAQAIKAHVASMSQRLRDGREFNIFSDTLPVLFENRDKINSRIETTDKGSIVTRTSNDTKVVAALQGHAAEVTELVQDGMAAMHRGMMSRMAMGSRGHGAGMGPGFGPRPRFPSSPGHNR
ncbi:MULTISPECIES: hypothetical protein [unclassified Variovorax]|uniref:hypothetical protein n=1 Tax=unclassified Variovorax TaxID=663243 RepID=UPI000A657A6A|nr:MULTISPECIES: hypothetical protein [unclassified Variovorax]PNG59898.1 hypothetical protein CHC07_01627 [Variovorax sp. B4]PNG60311.1 hypothetical protein CHC06_00208 [Variovorax sp. B2]VTV13838.1 hypothetical protein WDL1CHR_04463 [Variovorax sp. WDL1]